MVDENHRCTIQALAEGEPTTFEPLPRRHVRNPDFGVSLLRRVKPKVRDASGRFRRFTRDDMNWLEQMIFDAEQRLAGQIAHDILHGPSVNELLSLRIDTSGRIGRSIRVRLPADYKIEVKNPLGRIP